MTNHDKTAEEEFSEIDRLCQEVCERDVRIADLTTDLEEAQEALTVSRDEEACRSWRNVVLGRYKQELEEARKERDLWRERCDKAQDQTIAALRGPSD